MSRHVIGVKTYRRHLQAMYRPRPDDSHGEGYFNSGISAALRALNAAALFNMRTPCERDIARQKAALPDHVGAAMSLKAILTRIGDS